MYLLYCTEFKTLWWQLLSRFVECGQLLILCLMLHHRSVLGQDHGELWPGRTVFPTHLYGVANCVALSTLLDTLGTQMCLTWRLLGFHLWFKPDDHQANYQALSPQLDTLKQTHTGSVTLCLTLLPLSVQFTSSHFLLLFAHSALTRIAHTHTTPLAPFP